MNILSTKLISNLFLQITMSRPNSWILVKNDFWSWTHIATTETVLWAMSHIGDVFAIHWTNAVHEHQPNSSMDANVSKSIIITIHMILNRFISVVKSNVRQEHLNYILWFHVIQCSMFRNGLCSPHEQRNLINDRSCWSIKST